MAIALLTDFGTQDYYVAAMKGVILSIDTNANIVDITHEIPPQDIATASFILKACYKDFPPGSIFVCVVDPGVGSDRRALVVETESYKFVAPDNGLLDNVLSEAAEFNAFSITNRKYMRREVGNTFHGRDIFAPVAGYLSAGIEVSECGEPVNLGLDAVVTPVNASMTRDVRIIYIDRFGNLITDIRNDKMPEYFELNILGTTIAKICNFFAEAEPGELFLFRGSAGYVEIAVRDGSAERKLQVDRGDHAVLIPLHR